ncbi:MAG: hypothetical protein P1U39_00650 [Legionellaceae bacterium]|nr:hypothetical protein [Legionellaceae bacterium]
MNFFSKIKVMIPTAALLSLSTAYAGTMGNQTVPMFKPYLGGEVSYNWIQRDDPSINGFSPRSNVQHWGGRFSVGMLRLYTDTLGFTAEIGGGYYGDETTNIPQVSTVGKISVDAYDVLVGALYKFEKFDVFGKVGFMVENFRTKVNQQSLSQMSQGTFITGTSDKRWNSAAALPEIKVGGIYNVCDNLGITLAYMHAFGSTPGTVGNLVASPGSINTTQFANQQNPSLDSIFLGLRYYIV